MSRASGQVEMLSRTGREDSTGLLIDRLAAAIVDDSLPIKDVERELRGSVADVALHRRGLCKRETASRCGVTEKSIENYLKEVRVNPKSPEREVVRVLQDQMLSLEQIHERVHPLLAETRTFTLDDARRALDKLLKTGEVQEYPERKYRAVERRAVRYPETVEGHRELVDQKARDLDYIIVRQKEATEEEIFHSRQQRYSRVVRDSNLVRIDFTCDVAEADLPRFYEEISAKVAELTKKYETKNGRTRVRVLLGMRRAATALLLGLLSLVAAWPLVADDGGGTDSWELDGLVLRNRPMAMIEEEPAALDSSRERSGGPRPSSLVTRGDVDLSERVDLSDAIVLGRYLTTASVDLPCPRAADANADRRVSVSDMVYILVALFSPNSGLVLGEFDALRSADDLPCDAAF
jgi:hypothetical protein